jgi:7-alpha-hydroxysteroid dehydrogenase
MTIRLDGEVAIITGGGRAIGCAQARLIGSSGGAVVVADLFLKKAEAIVDGIRAVGGHVLAYALDVRDATAWASVVHAAEASFGPVTSLANNARANVRVSFDDQTEAMWD